MDGTFKVAPLLFEQLYVIRTMLDESAVPVVCISRNVTNNLTKDHTTGLSTRINNSNDIF